MMERTKNLTEDLFGRRALRVYRILRKTIDRGGARRKFDGGVEFLLYLGSSRRSRNKKVMTEWRASLEEQTVVNERKRGDLKKEGRRRKNGGGSG
jgi:hypothetical protein